MAKAIRKSSVSDHESDHEQSKVSLSKRRKTESAFVPTFKQDLSSSDDVDDVDDDTEDSVVSASSQAGHEELGHGDSLDRLNDTNDQDIKNDPHLHPSRKVKRSAEPIKALTKEELEQVNAAKAKTGVLYLSKVPPFMKPQKVKHLLSIYGETNRIFLAPEDPKSYSRRVRFGGNKRKMFVEGWIEFVDKKKAKLVAETLNAQKIGGKKGSFYHDDLWNLKYLPKFKWDDLTAQIAAENASRQARLTAHIEQGKREAGHYIKNAERAKMIKNIQATRAARAKSDGNGEIDIVGVGRQQQPEERIRRHFNQRDVKDKTKAPVPSAAAAGGDEKLNRVMKSIFG